MPFKKILRELVESVPGATGAVLVDWEGEAVDQYSHFDEYDMKVIGAHGGILFSRMKEVQGEFPTGDLEQTVIATDGHYLIAGAAGAEYTLVMTMTRDGIAGSALYRFRHALAALVKEIY